MATCRRPAARHDGGDPTRDAIDRQDSATAAGSGVVRGVLYQSTGNASPEAGSAARVR